MRRTLRYVLWTGVGYLVFVAVLNTALEIGERYEYGDVGYLA